MEKLWSFWWTKFRQAYPEYVEKERTQTIMSE